MDAVMKKTYQLENLDCANCASKMEIAVSKISGVQSATVSFLTQKLVIEADESEFDRIIRDAVKVCKKIEPDCTVLL